MKNKINIKIYFEKGDTIKLCKIGSGKKPLLYFFVRDLTNLCIINSSFYSYTFSKIVLIEKKYTEEGYYLCNQYFQKYD